MCAGHLSLSPKNQQDLEFLAAFSPYIFPLKRNKSFINESSMTNPYLAETKGSRVGNIWPSLCLLN